MADEEQQKEFLAENEVMDLSAIRGGTFCVAVATGMPNGGKFLCTTLHGPYSFTEMVQEVGEIWVQNQHHAKAIIMEKDVKKKVKVLDENTIDYIEAHYVDIIMEETLAGIPEDRVFTCAAGVVAEADPKPEEKPS